ncbi:hypothetical protein FNV43_RR05149 [Rhamnella rubrinervis]|uniref:MBD domain-containing protein n=1 Tax=Rhamnella rubrinervis TaxID=2594499 RepID=A0A8K0MQ75_9ROSA|nr:hypothetical protein FNV43_RR05149 [Rhamnella rubrinervis]
MSEDPNPNNQPVKHTAPDGPSDPLLKSGSFIVGSFATNGQSSMEPRKAKSSAPDKGARACPAAESSNGGQPATPMTGSENTEFQAERGKRKATEQEMSWLPAGWHVVDKVRSSGATAGTRDKYYVDPVSGRRFRSKIEVLYFLETGSLRKKKKSMENSDADAMGSGGQKQKSSKTAKNSTLNFDFSNVPEKVDWVLTDSTEESWTPYFGDDKVPESSKQEWAVAFTCLTSKNSCRNY